jgi:fengycin family lipopeptide synthetase E
MKFNLDKWKDRKLVNKEIRLLKREIRDWQKKLISTDVVKKFDITPIQYMYLCFQDYSGICYRYQGELDIKQFNKAYASMVHQFEFLRSHITYQSRKYQWIEYAAGEIGNIPLLDISSYSAEVKEQFLEKSIKDIYLKPYTIFYTLFYRAYILKESEESYVLIFPFSHIIFDALSASIFEEELLRRYQMCVIGEKPEVVELDYPQYLEQLKKGVVNISEQQLIEKFALEDFLELSKKTANVVKSYNDTKKTRFVVNVDIAQNYNLLIGYSISYAYQICHYLLQLDTFPVYVTNIGRIYEMLVYDKQIGSFVDYIPYIMENKKEPLEYQDDINSLSMSKNRNNINFVRYILSGMEEDGFKEAKRLLSDSYEYYRIIINFVGFTEDDQFEPIIYKFSENRMLDTLLISCKIVNNKMKFTVEASHYIEQNKLLKFIQDFHMNLLEIKYS